MPHHRVVLHGQVRLRRDRYVAFDFGAGQHQRQSSIRLRQNKQLCQWSVRYEQLMQCHDNGGFQLAVDVS